MAYQYGTAQQQLAATYEGLQERIKAAGKHLQAINEQTAEAEIRLARIRNEAEQAAKDAARENAKAQGQARRYATYTRKAREEHATIRRQVDEAKLQLAADQRRAAEVRAQHSEHIRTISYAHIEYLNAVIAHPEDVIEGPRRLALLNHEARHLKAVS